MKTFLSLFIMAVLASQIDAAALNITILYETLCSDCMNFFTKQLLPTYQDPKIQENVFVELVPFGNANYTGDPWTVTCQHGVEECLGNDIHSCFIVVNGENYKQVAWTSCTMSTDFPPAAGEECAQKLGYSYEGMSECLESPLRIQLEILNARRTDYFKGEITFIPSIIYDNVYNAQDQNESLTDFRAVVLRKLKANGILIE